MIRKWPTFATTLPRSLGRGPDRSMSTAQASEFHVLTTAADLADLRSEGATLIRDGSNALYRLHGNIVARIGRAGTEETAAREVRVSRWLASVGVPAVHALANIPQPTVVGSRPVTWWDLLPEHRSATTAELGVVLRRLHGIARPSGIRLPVVDPFAGLDDSLDRAIMPAEDRAWLRARLGQLREQYQELDLAQPRQVVHGDAWQANVAVPYSTGTPVLLDLEHAGMGNPAVDLAPIAGDYVDFARISDVDYQAFVDAYGGHDLTTEPVFRTLADIQEIRWTAFVLTKSSTDPRAHHEARHRIACLRGEVPRPWTWTAF